MPKLKTVPPRLRVLGAVHTRPREQGSYGQGRGGRPWRRTVERIKARDEGLCQQCKREGLLRIGHECDHIVPLSQGGTDADTNLEMICTTHHRAKTAREARGG